MKCQRVYSPTPLAALTKLSIRLQQPNGNLVSASADTLDISGIFLSSDLAGYFGGSPDLTAAAAYADASGEYIWIDSRLWFSRYQVAPGDRIQVRSMKIFNVTPVQTDLVNYVQDVSGLLVVATAYAYKKSTTVYVSTTTGTNVSQGINKAGYSRFIIVRNRFTDPTSGSTSLKTFDTSNNSTLIGSGANRINNISFISARLINLSHQTQLIFRIVTRDYDSTSLLRPDNL
jgi:hypothetical protein